METEKAIEPLGVIEDYTGYGATQITFKVYSLSECTMRDVLRSLGITRESMDSDDDDDPRRRYIGSGLWNAYVNRRKQLEVHFDVGCWCSHDCCGHLCGLTIQVWTDGSYAYVQTWATRNY